MLTDSIVEIQYDGPYIAANLRAAVQIREKKSSALKNDIELFDHPA